MKKILFCLLAGLLLTVTSVSSEAQQNEPIYLNNPLIGPYISEFALNGLSAKTTGMEPFIQNGRIYFCGIALSISAGSLRPGFEFNLDLGEHFYRPRIKAVYRGQQSDPVPPDAVEGIFVAGYAERGSIIITDVFFSLDDMVLWGDTVQLEY